MKIFDKQRMKQEWRELMHSAHRRISCGAENISRMLKFARGSNWRRHQSEWGHHHPKGQHHHKD